MNWTFHTWPYSTQLRMSLQHRKLLLSQLPSSHALYQSWQLPKSGASFFQNKKHHPELVFCL
jgi:hypothetical protein